MPVSLRNLLVLLLSLVPVLLVVITVAFYAVNFPYWDDYMVQEHLLRIKANVPVYQKLRMFFDQHWEHRIVWTRVAFFVFFKLNGALNYIGLTLFGAGGMLWLLWLLWQSFRHLNLPLGYFIPVPFWLFTLQSYENLIWAMASIQNFYILVFALGVFYLLATNTFSGRTGALLLAALAAFTSGNGALVLIVGLIVLVWQRHWRWVAGWAAATLLCLFAFFFDYQRITFFPSPFRYPYSDWVKGFFVFLGSFADPHPYYGFGALGYTNLLGAVVLLGSLLFVGSFYYLWKIVFTSSATQRSSFWNAFFLGSILFIFGTGLITVYSRVGFAGPSYLLQSRYKVYTALVLCLVYLYGLSNWRTGKYRRVYAGAVSVSTILLSLLSSYLGLEGVINQHRRILTDYFNETQKQTPDQQRGIRLVYGPTATPFYANVLPTLVDQALLTQPATSTVDSVYQHRILTTVLKSNAVNPTPARPDGGTYLILKNAQRTYLFPARPVRPAPFSFSGLNHYFTPNRIHAQVLHENVKGGRYRLGLLTREGNRNRVAMTDRYIQFAGH